MELLLNVLWMLMAAGLLWTWRAHWVHQRRRTLGHSLREWTAVSVALILLFFAVSMTDDLHSDVLLFDECSTGRRGLSFSVHAHQPSTRVGITLQGGNAVIVPRVAPLGTLGFVQGVVFVAESSPVPVGKRSLSPRAPPSSVFNA